MGKWSISAETVKDNILKVQSKLKDNEAFYVASSDQFLSEYVPLEDCFRYYLSGFTGSTAELLITKSDVYLYLDGRYHEQGAKEKHELVSPVNVEFNSSNRIELKKRLIDNNIENTYYIAQRTSFDMHATLKSVCTTTAFDQSEFVSIIGHIFSPTLKQPYLLEDEIVGMSSSDKLKDLFREDQKCGYFLCSLDQVAWITNCRGFHAPSQSFYNAKAFLTPEKIFLFSDGSYNWPKECEQNGLVEMVSFDEIDSIVKSCVTSLGLETLYYEKHSITMDNYLSLLACCDSGATLLEGGVLSKQMIKNSCEIDEMGKNFMSSNHAIINSLRWLKEDAIKEGASELDFYNKVNSFYKEQGAVDQSFQTIAAVDENSSIIHFGDSSAQKIIKDNSVILLDSGAHYRSGYATDTTRSICVGEKPHADFIKYYTLVLKGLIRCEMAVFPAGTIGAQIDAYAREGMRQFGLDYAHGTGHGVGINVHEGGFSISSKSIKPLYESMVGSLEPGIYVTGFGGIRLENIVAIEKHPTFSSYLKFRPLTLIGYDFNLIDTTLLTKLEIEYLIDYETKCVKLGTSFNWHSSALYKEQ